MKLVQRKTLPFLCYLNTFFKGFFVPVIISAALKVKAREKLWKNIDFLKNDDRHRRLLLLNCITFMCERE